MKFLRQVLQQSRTLAAAPRRARQRWRGARTGFITRASCAIFALPLLLVPSIDHRHARPPSAAATSLPAAASAAAPPHWDVAAGRRLLEAYQCGACHRIHGVSGAQGTQGPALLQWGQRSYIAGRVPNTQPLLAAWLVQPAQLVPGTPMPSMGVTPQHAQQMAAYLLQAE